MEYSIKKLKELANDDLIYPKPLKYYEVLLKESIKANEWNIDLDDGNAENNIHIDDLWYDCNKIINELAQLVLDERQKRIKFLDELKKELKDTISNLSSKKFDEFY
jgi:hypothetical protein